MIRSYCDICGVELPDSMWPTPVWLFFRSVHNKDKYVLTVQIEKNGAHNSVLCQPCLTYIMTGSQQLDKRNPGDK
jgi:hypothetical protein